MKQLTHEINLNMTQPNNFEYVYAMQSDYDSEIVVATLYDGNTLYTIDANQAVLNGVTENGNTIVYNNVTIDSDKHRISFPLTKEMLFESGDTRFVVSFFDTINNQRKSAFPFIIKSASDAEGTLPVSVLKKISEYVAEAAASAQEAKESAKNAKDSEDNAKKYATEAKSYAVGDTGIREGENTDNSKYYYEIIKALIENGGIGTEEKPANIKYYPTYGEFKTDFADGKIDKETLILIGEDVDHLYSVQIIPGDNMTWDASSGNLKQNSIIEKLNEVVLKANNDYYFPTSYFVASSNGIMVTRDSFTQISVSGKPTANTKIALLSPTEKGNQVAPTGLSNGYTQINGTTTNMEYAESASSSRWISCTSGSTSVATKTWYVRYKETDTLKASPATQVIVELEPAPSSIVDLKVINDTTNSVTLSFTKPSGAVKVNLYCSTSSDVNNTSYEKQTSITNSDTAYTFTGLTTNKTYYFCAYAENSSGLLSTKSNVVSVTLEENSLPPITDLKIISSTSNSVTLDFTKPSNDVYLYCSTSSNVDKANYEKYLVWVSGLSGSNVSFEDLTSGKTYYFCAYNRSNGSMSAKSNVVSVTLSGTSSGGGSSSGGSSDSNKIYLYNEGNECTSITGGWYFVKKFETITNGDSECSKLSNCICITPNQNNLDIQIVAVNNWTNIISSEYKSVGIEYSYNNNTNTKESLSVDLFQNDHYGALMLGGYIHENEAVNIANKNRELTFGTLDHNEYSMYENFGIQWHNPQINSTLKIHKIYLIKQSS